MKRSSLSFFTALLASALLLPSCVRDVVLDAGENVQVAVECVMSNDSIQKLYLCFTKGASRNEADPLTEAVATLIDLTESKTVGQFVKGEEDNLWTLDYTAREEHHYRLEVQVPGYDMIWAEDTMPQRADISSYTTHFKQLDERDYNLDSLYPDTYAYFFNGTYFIFGSDRSEPIWVYGLDIDEPHPDDPLSGIGPIASEIYTDIPTADNFNVKNKKYIPEVLLHIDYTVDNVIIGVNVLNYPDLAGSLTHDRFLRIDGGKAHEPFLITCNFNHWYEYDKFNPQIRYYGTRPMVFMSVSDAYDDYLKTALIMEEMQSSSDMSTIYLRDNLPSNIQGGVGIFGCKYEQTLDNLVQDTFIPIEEYSKHGIDPETHEYIKD